MRDHPAAASLLDTARGEGIQVALEGALNEGNAALVTWLCVQLFSGRATAELSTCFGALSQFVLLCLVQQLGTDLTQLPRYKLDWLHIAFQALNPADTDIAE